MTRDQAPQPQPFADTAHPHGPNADRAERLTALKDAVLKQAWSPVFEKLETRQLLADVSLVDLNFSNAQPGTLVDKDGEGTGFTVFQQNASNTGFQASNVDLDTATGLLKITTPGNSSNYQATNTQQNVLEHRFDATSGSFTVQVRLDGSTRFDQRFQQAGVTFGPDADHYVKVVAGRWAEGQRIEFVYESTDASGASIVPFSAKLDAGSLDGQQHVDLRLQFNAANGTVTAGYRLPGGNWVDFGTTVSISAADRAAFFNAAAKAGVVQNDSQASSNTVSYDSFSVIRHDGSEDDRPTVTGVTPANGSINVTRDIGIFANIAAGTAGGRIDAATLNASTVKLIRSTNGQQVNANVKTSGAGDVIIVTPSGAVLDANTRYTLIITDGVKDILGNAVVPFTSSFTTGTAGGTVDTSISFNRTSVATASGERWTGLTFGPDGKLYTTTVDGMIYRYDVAANGTFTNKTQIATVRNNAGFRALIGLVFDPASTAGNLKAYAIHGAFEGILAGDAPDWSGKISVLSGANLGSYRDLVTGLPRSVGDHLTNQASFGPDGKMYLSQAANTAMGASDPTWSETNGTPRPERLLTAAILQIDIAAIGSGTLNVRTEGVANPYNPFAANAPVKIYATGVRNAYDLLWHSNGTLYAPTNGSGNGGNTPTDPRQSGTGLTNVNEVQRDYLFAVTQGGYYGSPNPTRAEFVLNGGNPTAGVDPHEVASYPVGTQPDSNWRVGDIAYDFGLRVSPNGIIEYRDNASTGNPFGGSLDGKIFVVRYATPQDIMILTPGADGSIVEARDGFSGLEDFTAPIDIVQQPGTGNLIVADYAARQIYMLAPQSGGTPSTPGSPGNAVVSKSSLFFNDIHTSSDRSPIQNITLTNTGTGPLTINNITLGGVDAGGFRITNRPVNGTVLAAGASVTISIDFTADAKRIHEATLTIDTANNDLSVKLRGIGTTGLDGQNEPSLQRILDLYQIPVDVGDPDPNTTHYPDDSSLRGDEVIAPRFVKAGSGKVTIEVLATMAGQKGSNSLIFGTYEPGSPQTMQELFRVAAADRQSVNPGIDGVTSFDPGSDAFALWSSYAAFNHRVVYGENSLNTWETNPDQRRKVRVFPLKDANGQVVPNAYVIGFEEWEQQSDQNDIVLIIRNVTPVVGAELGIENLDGVPFPDRLVMSRISPDGVDTTTTNTVHDTATLRIHNTGESPLIINSLQLSSNEFTIVSGGVSSPVTLQPGQTRNVVVRFIYDRAGDGQEIRNATLTINSNDADEPARRITLAGLWQSDSENNSRGISQEPKVSQIIQALGYSINIGQLNTNGQYIAAGEEVLSRYWTRADDSKPTGVRILGAWHGANAPSQIRWFAQGGSTPGTVLFRHFSSDGQTLLPRHSNGQAGYAEFSTNATFGFYTDGSYSDESLHSDLKNEHAWRFYAAKDANGNIIPDTYIAAHDYVGATFTNYDYQDNVYLITNVKPASAPQQVRNLSATSSNGVTLSWTANTAGNLIGYNVYRDTGSGFVKLTDAPTTQTTFIDATANGTATYRVVAVDYHGQEGTAANIQGNGTGGGTVVKPNAPTGLASALNGNQVTLTWADNANNETGYQIERSTNGGAYTLIGNIAANSTSYTDLTTTSATTYQYRVRAINSAGASAYSNVVNASTPSSNVYGSTDVGSPALGSTATLTANVNYDVTVGAGSNISGNADNFRFVNRAISGDFDLAVRLQDLSGPSGSLAGIMARSSLGSGSAHISVLFNSAGLGSMTYRDANGGSTSTAGNVTDARPTEIRLQRVGSSFTAYVSYDGATWVPISTKQLALGDTLYVGFAAAGNSTTAATARFRDIRTITATTPAAPTAPSALTAAASTDRITLGWADNANNEAGYRIERKTGTGSFTVLTTLGVNATGYVDTTAAVGTTYTYRVVAINAGGEALSNEASATIAAPVTKPAAPTGLAATAVEAGVSVEWFDNASNETGFRIERRIGTGAWSTVGNVAANATSFLDDTTAPATTYTYRVFAVNAAGDSNASNTANATTPAANTSNPTSLYEQRFDGNGTLEYRTYTGGIQNGGTFGVVNGVFVVDNTGGFGSWYTSKLNIPNSGKVRFSIDVSSSANVNGQLNVGVRLDGGAYQLLRSFRDPVSGTVTVELDNINASQIQIEIQGKTTSGQFRFDNIILVDGAATGGGNTGGGNTGGGNTGGGTGTTTDLFVEAFDGNGNLPYKTYTGGVQAGGFFGVRNGAFVAENTGGFASWYTNKISLPGGGPYTFSIDVTSTANVAGQLNVGVRIGNGAYQLLRSFRDPVSGTVTVTLPNVPAGDFQIEIQAKTTAGSFSFDNVKISTAGTTTGGGDTGGGNTGGGNTGGGNTGGNDTGGGDTGGGTNTGSDYLVETFPQNNGTQQGTGALGWKTYTGGIQPGGIFAVQNGAFRAENTGGFGSWYTSKFNLPAGSTYSFSVDVTSSANVAGQLNVTVRINGQAQVVRSFRDPVTGTVTATLSNIPAGEFQIEIQAKTTAGFYAFDNVRITTGSTGDDSGGNNGGGNNGGGNNGGGNNNGGTSGTVSSISWSAAPQPNTSYAESGKAVVGNDVYLFGGYRADWSSVNDVYRFRNNQWTKLANMPEPLTHAGIETVGSNVWFAGGYIGQSNGGQLFGSRKVWIYNSTNDTWSRGPDLPAERAGGDLVLIGNQLHFLGGQNTARTVDTKEHWVMDINNQSAGWQSRAAMPVGRNHLAAETHNGLLYFFGSQSGHDEQLTSHTEVFAYNPATNTWTQKASMPAPRNHMHQTLVKKDGKLYIFAGQSNHNNPQDDIFEYNFATDTWRTVGTTPQARTSPSVALLPDGRVLLVGGFRPGLVYQSTFYGTFNFT